MENNYVIPLTPNSHEFVILIPFDAANGDDFVKMTFFLFLWRAENTAR